MMTNPHIATAVDAFERLGENFHNAVLWHIMHGVVLISPEFLSVGYYCRRDEIGEPAHVDDADTIFVTFMTGSMSALKRVCPETIRFIAFKRGLKNGKGDQIYEIEKFKQLIN